MATLEDYAKSQGFKSNGEGQGNAAFAMAAAKSLSETYKANPTAATTIGASQQAKDSVGMYDNSSYAKSGTTNDLAKYVASGQQNQNEGKPSEKAVDNTAMINSQAESMAAAIRAQIAQRNQEIQGRITALPDKYQPDKNASEVAKAQQVRSLNEIAANQGDRGGIGRQNTLAAMVGGENRLNSVNLAQKQEEAALNNEIGRLILEGDIQQANIQTQKLRDLIANNTAMNNTNYERQFNAEGRQQTQGNWLSEFDQRNAAEKQAQQNWSTTNTQTQDQNKLTNTRYDEGIAYNQGRDKIADTLAANKTAYEKQIDNRDFEYNVNKDLGYVNPTAAQQVPDEVRQQLSGYEGNYAQAAKELMDSGQVGLAKYAQILSNEKMFKNPALLKQYGQPFQTLQNQQVQSGISTEILQRAAMTIDNLAKQYNLDNIMPQELARAKQLVSIGEAELAAKLIENTNAPAEFKMKMGVMAEQISSSKANTSQGWSQIGIQQQNANTNESARKDSASNNNQIRQDTFNNTKDQADYQDTYDSMVKQFATPIQGANGVTGYSISDENKSIIRDRLKAMAQNGVSKTVINKLGGNLGIQ